MLQKLCPWKEKPAYFTTPEQGKSQIEGVLYGSTLFGFAPRIPIQCLARLNVLARNK